MRDDIITATYMSARGEALSWGVDGAHVLSSISGISGLTALVSTSRTPGQDGEIWQASRLPMRTITMACALVDDARGTERARLMRVCDARQGPGLLTLTGYGHARQISAYVDSSPMIVEDASLGWLTYTLTLTCPLPYWQATREETMEMATSVGGLRWPVRLPARFATLSTTGRYLARNAGTAECPVRMEFAGGAINPVLRNETTGEEIRIHTQVPASSTLVIDTAHGGKRAYLRDEGSGRLTDAMGYLDLDSVFWALMPGDNYLSYDADDGARAARVTVRWRPLFAGF